MNKKKLILIITILLLLLLGGLGYYWLRDPLVLKEQLILEINESYNAIDGIEKMNRGKIEDVIVDDSKVQIDLVGTYPITYTVEEKQFELLVEVVDTKAPIVKCKESMITDEEMPIDVNDWIVEISDDSDYQVFYLEKYDFNKAGNYDLEVVVEDTSGNRSIEKVNVEIRKKDVDAPIIEGKEKVSLNINAEFDPFKDMKVSDDRDENVKLEIVSNNVDTSKKGTYEVVYEAIDYTGNKVTFTKVVVVLESKPQGGNANYGGGKVVYLTFDDGPSYNTGAVLDILNRYNVKATFFVTGSGSEYRHYITQAYQSGHTIGLHTYTHDYAIYSSLDTYFADLKRIDDLVYSLTGYHSPYIRFPGGASNSISANYNRGIMTLLTQEVQNRGYQYYDWNVDSMDASGINVSTQTIMNGACVASNGTVMILFHDTFGKDTTVKALPSIIEYYQNLGYTFKGIDQSTPIFHHGVNN